MNEAQLKEIEAFSAKLMSAEEIAIILEFDREAFLAQICDGNNAVAVAFLRGQLKIKAEIQESILKLAKQGSSPAQTLALKMLKDAEIKQLWES